MPPYPKIHLHKGDLSPFAYTALKNSPALALDTETLGLNLQGDRLCLLQISVGDGSAHLVQFLPGKPPAAPHVASLLGDDKILKIFHYGRFDIAILYKALGVLCSNVYCTKTASRVVRTFTDRHGLRELCRVLLGVDISKGEQTSDWGTETLTQAQQLYAANDVLHLHALQEKLDGLLAREGRAHLAHACFEYLPTRALLDVYGWPADILMY